MIYYQDPEKQKKLEEAIEMGFIIRTRHPDGVLCYELTPAGLHQWQLERIFR